MKLLTFIVGTGENRHGDLISEKDKRIALDKIRAMLASEFGGYTESATLGGWMNPQGKLVTEQGRKFEVYTYKTENALDCANTMARLLNQHSVVLSKSDVISEFVEQ